MSLRPLPLRNTAQLVARNYRDKGAIVISVGEEGTRIGVEGLTPEEAREALCVAINYSFQFEEDFS